VAPRLRRSRAESRPTNAGSSRQRVLERSDRLLAALAPRALRRRFESIQRTLGITRVGQIAVVGAIGLWFMARVVAGTAIYLFAYGCAALVVISYLIAPRKLKLEGERAGLYPRAQEGDRLDVEVKLTAKRTVSTFILEERVPERLGNPVRLPIAKLSSGSAVSHRYGLRAARRGVYEIGPLVAIAGDPLGLSQRETIVAEPFELLVHPRVELVSDRPLTRQFEDPPIRPPVSKPWPSGLEFYGMREYALGDDLRRIVWRASARTGKIMVREAEQGITDQITIVIDTDRGTHSRDGEDLSESFETGVRVVASLGVRHLREGYEVSVFTNQGPLTRPLRGATSQLILLDNLARLEQSRQPFSQALMHILSSQRRDAHMIFVTPHLGNEEAARLRLLLNRGISILVVALLWDEEDTHTMGIAAALGCAVVGVHPGQDIATALAAELGAGAGR
jgi:uncharacterized protein (DUF58 family)